MGTAVIDIVMLIVDSKTTAGYKHYCFVGSGLFRLRNVLCHHEGAISYRAL
jgi:hypothetical protein